LAHFVSTNDAVVLRCSHIRSQNPDGSIGFGPTIRWVATVRTSEVFR
jgi:hypothetical protein